MLDFDERNKIDILFTLSKVLHKMPVDITSSSSSANSATEQIELFFSSMNNLSAVLNDLGNDTEPPLNITAIGMYEFIQKKFGDELNSSSRSTPKEKKGFFLLLFYLSYFCFVIFLILFLI
jgi:hypothetical protein